jgi:hypothetical protein
MIVAGMVAMHGELQRIAHEWSDDPMAAPVPQEAA